MKTRRPVLLAALCAVAAARSAGAAGENVAALVERYDHLSVGAAKQVTPMTLTSGHFECRLGPGRAAPVLAGEEVVGIYYEGAGTMSYVSTDPLEASTFAWNVRKVSSLRLEKTPQGARVTDNFARVLWLSAGRPLPPLEGAAGGSLADAFAKEREKFRRIVGPRPAHELALRALDAPNASVVRAELEGGSEDVVYRLEMEDPSESLSILRKSWSDDPESRRYLYPEYLSVQLVGRDARDPPVPRVVLTDVDVELGASDSERAEMKVVETLVPLGRPMSAVRLDLERTVYTTFGNNLSPRTERLRRVTDENGRELAFDHERDEVVVQLAEPAPPDAPIKLRFEIDGDFLVHPGGDSYWELGIEPWFPQPSLAGQFYTFHALVRVKKPFIPFAPGRTVRRAAEGDENVLETRVDKPICFAIIMAGGYEVEEETRNGVAIRVATYALKNPRAVKQLTNLAGNIIQYYQEFLGPFPMPELNIIEINDFGFGQAPPGTMFITKEAFNPLIEEENQLYSQGVNERFAHEIAHQYWGTAVKMPSREEQWLTESFAEYSAALFLKAYKNEATFNALVKHWRSRATFATSEVPIPLANRAYASDARTRFFIRTGLLYDKGPAVLRALHKELGDETFFTFLKSYQKSFAWKFASTKKLAGLLQYMTKKDYMPFFDRYYWGIEMPKD
jgi:hypothetical protein